jgi:hypothetical protein
MSRHHPTTTTTTHIPQCFNAHLHDFLNIFFIISVTAMG